MCYEKSAIKRIKKQIFEFIIYYYTNRLFKCMVKSHRFSNQRQENSFFVFLLTYRIEWLFKKLISFYIMNNKNKLNRRSAEISRIRVTTL